MMPNRPVFIMISALLCATSACAPIGRGIQQVGTQVHEETIALDHKVRDWFDSENQAGREPDLPDPTMAYCYKTLSDVSCYAQPIPGQERRLVGKQIPDPVFAEYIPIPETKPDVPVLIVEPASALAPAAGGSGVNLPTHVAVSDIPAEHMTYAAPEPVAKTAEEIPEYRQPRTLIPVFEGSVN